MEEISMLPYPNDNYFKAIVIKDIHRENISTKGNIPDFIPKGYKTWFTEIGGESWKDRILNKKSVVCPENNRWSTNIPSEYFEIVEESKFEEGKWYKNKESKGLYRNISRNEVIWSSGRFDENYSVKETFENWELLTDLSEIQQFLPKGHADKIKTEVIPEYVECIKGTNTDNYNHLGKIYKVEYYNSYTGEIKILGKTISSIFFGEKSLVDINRTDYKPSTKEAYEAQNKPKQLTVGDLIEGEIYFCKNSSFGNGNSGYIFLKIGSYSIKHIDICNKDYSQTGWNFWTDTSSFDLRQATPEEKKWLNICIKWNKFIPKEDLHLYDDFGLLIPPQKCEECNDTGRVMKAQLTSYSVGRYLKALIDHPNAGIVGKGEYGLITDILIINEKVKADFPSQKSYICSNLKDKYELMPEGWKPKQPINEEEEKGWIPQVGDWVVLISGEGKPNWSNNMKTYVGRCVQLLKKQGDKKMYLIQEDNKKWSWEYSERTKHFRKALPHEISSNKINEYGLYVGYKLDANIITKWAKNINNYLYDGGWKKIGGTFFGDRIIEKIDFKDGKPAFLVSGTMNIWLKAEGFREFDAHESLQEKEGFEGKKDFVDLSNKGIEVQIYRPGDKKTITTNINTITSIQEQLIKPKQTILF